MRVRVDSSLSMAHSDVPPKLLGRLRAELSFPNPAYFDRIRRGAGPGSEPEMLCYVEESDGEIRLPRGAIGILRGQAAQQKLCLAMDDQRVLPLRGLNPLPELPLRDYQSAAVEKLAKLTQGSFIMPCGSGKTRAGMGAIRRLGTPTLVLVHTLDLAEQWLGELRDKLGIEAGLVGDGEARVAPVTVAIVQSLCRWDRPRLDAFLGGFGLLIVEEAHHIVASTFQSVVHRCPARYRLGLTATPARDDGLGPVLDLFLGGRLLTVTHDQLVAAGVLKVPEIRSVETDFTYPYQDGRSYAPMMAAVAEDPDRNQLIIDAVVRDALAGESCLVLSGRVDHCRALAQAISERGARAVALTGSVGRKERKALLSEVREGQLRVLVATSLADEGLDLPRLSRVFLAFPGRSKSRATQRLGRVMRPHAEKASAVVVDFADRNVPILRRQHQERLRHFSTVLGIKPQGAVR